MAAAEYTAGRAGQPSPPQPGQSAVEGELWLLAVNRPTADVDTEWIVYSFTSQEDVPGWPALTANYTGGIRTAADIASPLRAAGLTVVLRHYSQFAVSASATTIPL